MVNRIVINNKKKKVKRLSSTRYYPSAFISNPCDQLFGPSYLDCSTSSVENNHKDKSFNSSINNCSLNNISINEIINDSNNTSVTATSITSTTTTISIKNENLINSSSNEIQINENDKSLDQENLNHNTSINNISNSNEHFEYIPTPKWNKTQNSMLEELFKKSRYPKQSDLKLFAQRLNVMDTDVEEWFRKRRGRDRKTRRKNEVLKSLIDNYLGK